MSKIDSLPLALKPFAVSEADLRKICGSNSELLRKVSARRDEFAYIREQRHGLELDAKRTQARIAKHMALIRPAAQKLSTLLKKDDFAAKIIAREIGKGDMDLSKLVAEIASAAKKHSSASGTFDAGRKPVPWHKGVAVLCALTWIDICEPKQMRTLLAKTLMVLFGLPKRTASKEADIALKYSQLEKLAFVFKKQRELNGELYNADSAYMYEQVRLRRYFEPVALVNSTKTRSG